MLYEIFVNIGSLYTRMLFPTSLVEIGPVVLEKIIKFHLRIWLKLVQWFFKFHPCIFAILISSSLGKESGPSFEATWTPITQGYFVPR